MLSSTSINVTWGEIPPIRRNGIITAYEVLYEPLETFGGFISSKSVNTTNTYFVLFGLQEYVDYNISVRAYTEVGPGPYSQGITNQTFQDCEFFSFSWITLVFTLPHYSTSQSSRQCKHRGIVVHFHQGVLGRCPFS